MKNYTVATAMALCCLFSAAAAPAAPREPLKSLFVAEFTVTPDASHEFSDIRLRVAEIIRSDTAGGIEVSASGAPGVSGEALRQADQKALSQAASTLGVNWIVTGTVYLESPGEYGMVVQLYSADDGRAVSVFELKAAGLNKALASLSKELAAFYAVISSRSGYYLHRNPAMRLVFEYTEFNPDINPQYAIPYGVFCDGGGLLVSCYGTVSRLDPRGKLLAVYGENGPGRGKYQLPQCVASDDSASVYVLDNMGKKILVYDKDGRFRNEITHPASYPMNFAVTGEGKIFIPDTQKGAVYIYTAEGKRTGTISFAQGELIAVAGSGGRVRCLTSGGMDYRLTWYNGNGDITRTKGLSITRNAYYITAFDMDERDNFYGLDMTKNVIVKEDASGKSSWVIEKIEGSTREYLNTPYGISVTADGNNLYVVDMQNKRVLRFSEMQGMQPASGPDGYLKLALSSGAGTDKYLAYLNMALAANPDHEGALMEKAAYLAGAGLYRQSHDIYAALAEKNSGGKAAQELKKVTAAMHLDKARSSYRRYESAMKALGPESAREHYTEAVKNYEIVLKNDASNAGAKREYEKLIALGSQGRQAAPSIDIVEIRFRDVFAAMYKYYNENPVGTLSLKNSSGKTIEKIHAEVSIREFMDYPSESRTYREIRPGRELEIPLYAVFNNKILGVSEDTPLNAEIRVRYVVDGREQSVARNQSLALYNRNAMTWDSAARLASFFTPRDPVVKVYARTVVQKFRNARLAFMKAELQSAIEIFDSLGVYGMTYVSDPKTPFATFSRNRSQVDYIQYPRETLRFRTGDCDDLTALFCSLLENLGVETAMVTVPGHIFALLNTGVPAAKKNEVTGDPAMAVVLNGAVWVPVETTMMGRPFTEAWEKAAARYAGESAKGTLEVIMARAAWKEFAPVTLEDVSWEPQVPDLESVQRLYNADINKIINAELSRRLPALESMLKKSPNDARIHNSIGVAYARYGKYPDAEKHLQKAKAIDPEYFSPWNNLGNLALLENRLDEALASYKKAAELKPDDAQVRINLALIYRKMNMIDRAKEEFEKATALSPSLKEQFGGLTMSGDTKADDSMMETMPEWKD